MRCTRRCGARRGAVLIEFAFVVTLLILLILATLEFDRMLLVYTTMADSARAGLRYAIVHGRNRIGTGADGPSGPGSNPPEVLTVIRNNARGGLVSPAALPAACAPGTPGICVTYPDGSNAPGSRVQIRVAYAFLPFTILPLHANLGTTTQGVIAF
ncbi:MAG TPA: TadE/TadG family type IV pilus assembly protein [Bryobacteraceae bacterium]|nr:TadE/TadG family type IV pilus assembly protein [Bryobacteraceae bacterium]